MGIREEELLRLPFSKIARVLEALKERNLELQRLARLIGYEIWRKGAKNPPPIETYLKLEGDISETNEPTKEELDVIWEKYGKLEEKYIKKHKIRNK